MSTDLAEIPVAILAKDCASLNELEQFLASLPKPPECRVDHRFTPGLYSRTIHMPKGMVCTSKIHRTEHQYVVSTGVVKVWMEDRGWVLLQSPHVGITKPGARRALWVLEDTTWTTFHPTHKTNLIELEAELIEPHEIPRHREEIA